MVPGPLPRGRRTRPGTARQRRLPVHRHSLGPRQRHDARGFARSRLPPRNAHEPPARSRETRPSPQPISRVRRPALGTIPSEEAISEVPVGIEAGSPSPPNPVLRVVFPLRFCTHVVLHKVAPYCPLGRVYAGRRVLASFAPKSAGVNALPWLASSPRHDAGGTDGDIDHGHARWRFVRSCSCRKKSSRWPASRRLQRSPVRRTRWICVSTSPGVLNNPWRCSGHVVRTSKRSAATSKRPVELGPRSPAGCARSPASTATPNKKA